MIIEGIITCDGEHGPQVSALGPVVDESLSSWTLRPFQSSRIFTCLRSNPICIFHVVDDALPLVRLVLGQDHGLTLDSAAEGGWIIREACQWYRLEVTQWDLTHLRSEAQARLVNRGQLKPFWGWNRAKHALLEAAILISRAHLMPPSELTTELERLKSPIEKTAGLSELAAWQLIERWRTAQGLV